MKIDQNSFSYNVPVRTQTSILDTLRIICFWNRCHLYKLGVMSRITKGVSRIRSLNRVRYLVMP